MKVKEKLEVKHSFATPTLDTISAKRMLMKRLVQYKLFYSKILFRGSKPKTVNTFNELRQNPCIVSDIL